ncbi:hypothetical protein N7478_004481 [Penicillium angulare]|uniref:uncharacterized protein n=1 Tax=Penicillium angulare TaxID=116970 RepID=UPI0025409D43|nr:uncharacterized protein N7478_004481 [Penicillium angulare]KAJ5279109.1 hypothetical protein N7478_004481 [Penicillium angulare]
MDAKPQRIRVRGDENAPPAIHNNKTIHQRNKSMSALNVTQSAKNGNRRAFGDVSNTKELSRASRDDSALNSKPTLQVSEKPALSQPAQRPMSVSGVKGALNNVTTKPVNPAGKAQAVKSAKRSNPIFRDNHLEPVTEKEPYREAAPVRSTRGSESTIEEQPVAKGIKTIPDEKSNAIVSEQADTNYEKLAKTSLESDATLSDGIDESKAPAAAASAKQLAPIASEPEEYWEEEDSQTAPSLSRTDNTTGGTTTIIYPQFSAATKRQILQAKHIVEDTRTEEDIIEDFYDSTMVAEYSSEIFLHMRNKEAEMLPVADYMTNQAEIQWSMRSVLMDWLVQVHHRFNLLPETLYICVNYIDRFLSHKIVSLGKLQLVGATALFIAAKYEEINAPAVREIVYMVDGGYTVDEILKAERFMLTILDFELGWPGPMSFLRRISKADDYDLETRTVAKYFIEITIMDERFVCTPPSFSAAGAHCLARLMLAKGFWTPAHAYYAGYTYEQLLPVMTTMLECCESPQSHHQAIYEKYLDRRFKRASLFVEAEVRNEFALEPPTSLRNPARLDGTANY